MNTENALRQRITELLQEKGITLTALCLNSNITPSTVFDFMAGKSKCLKVITVKKLCVGANITLKEFFDKDYFNNTNEVFD